MNKLIEPALVLGLPLHELDGNSFPSRDACGHLGTVTGAVWGPRGRTFDASGDYIDCGAPAALDIKYPLSLLAWVKPYSAKQWQGITGRAEQYDLRLLNGTELQYWFLEAGTANYRLAAKTNAVVIGEWSFTAATFDGETARLYVNGGQVKSVPLPYLPADSANHNIVGKTSGAGVFDGMIGEVMIYNDVLDALQIEQIFRKTKWRYR